MKVSAKSHGLQEPGRREIRCLRRPDRNPDRSPGQDHLSRTPQRPQLRNPNRRTSMNLQAIVATTPRSPRLIKTQVIA